MAATRPPAFGCRGTGQVRKFAGGKLALGRLHRFASTGLGDRRGCGYGRKFPCGKLALGPDYAQLSRLPCHDPLAKAEPSIDPETPLRGISGRNAPLTHWHHILMNNPG